MRLTKFVSNQRPGGVPDQRVLRGAAGGQGATTGQSWREAPRPPASAAAAQAGPGASLLPTRRAAAHRLVRGLHPRQERDRPRHRLRAGPR